LCIKDENESLRNRINDMLGKMIKDSENTMMALEKAISSSVRLCVVAPTVNVHILDKKISMSSRVSEDSIRSFLQELLISYSFVYKQDRAEVSPDGATDLQEWLQVLLSRMQLSIEQHVATAIGDGLR
jgi:hypothetical protein